MLIINCPNCKELHHLEDGEYPPCVEPPEEPENWDGDDEFMFTYW